MNCNIRTSLTVIKEIIGDAPFLFEGTFPEGIAYAHSLGYDCVELHSTDPEELGDPGIEAALRENGMQISALGTGRLYVNAGLSLTSDDPQNRSEAVAAMMRYIDAASRFDCLVIIGCVRGNVPSKDAYEETIALLGESMTKLDEYARQKQVTMVFEPINRYENNYLCNTYEIADFIRRFDLTNIRMMIDTFHMNIEEVDILQAIRDNMDYIRYVHFADSNRWWPGKGHLDFTSIVDVLIKNGYNGIISAECLPLPSKEAAAGEWIRSVRGMLDNYE
ncbi:MAG: sugar phosphate isomerase/epimerase [Firmicutes bacterium]|nr:sugar phosphate isomerase/epimerase [Bacillota bacterium]MBQ9016613.1 sugar phosphate isomerase/epimerase [Bacillota bacterium]